MKRPLALALLAAAGLAVGLEPASSGPRSPGIEVVAAENVWGSIAAQVGGDRVHVTSVISSPATDPHDYEPTSFDARAIAGAGLVIVNGIGYDPWATRLVEASPSSGRIVLDVGKLVGVGTGGNPHRWYSPADVRKVVAEIARDYGTLDPGRAAYFRRRATLFEAVGLARYDGLIASIRRTFGGVPVGASESIFEPLARALRLRLVTPPSFLRATSEGAEPSVADKSAVDRQVAGRRIRVWVVNGQNSTPDVTRITDEARRRGIPVVTITETLVPARATFQGWQVRQLAALAAALARAAGR